MFRLSWDLEQDKNELQSGRENISAEQKQKTMFKKKDKKKTTFRKMIMWMIKWMIQRLERWWLK